MVCRFTALLHWLGTISTPKVSKPFSSSFSHSAVPIIPLEPVTKTTADTKKTSLNRYSSFSTKTVFNRRLAYPEKNRVFWRGLNSNDDTNSVSLQFVNFLFFG